MLAIKMFVLHLKEAFFQYDLDNILKIAIAKIAIIEKESSAFVYCVI